MRVTATTNNVLANTASIIAETFKAPNQDSRILSFKAPGEVSGPIATTDMSRAQPPEPPEKETVVRSHFKMIFISVLVLTILGFGAEILLNVLWANPTSGQSTAIAAADGMFKAGFGAIVGLLGGKQL